MNSCKVTCLLLLLLVYIVLYQDSTEGLGDEEQVEGIGDEEPTVKKEGIQKDETDDSVRAGCTDDNEWFVEDQEGQKHYCVDIGKSASCYDIDAVGREGWESCTKTCGNCANVQVTTVPQNILATFSGDPYEDFGVVLNMDTDRQWVGKQDGGDIRGYIDDDKEGDIANIMDRLNTAEDMLDLIAGGSATCLQPRGDCGGNEFPGCDDECLVCPSPETVDTEINKYIEMDTAGNLRLPARDYSCETIPANIRACPEKCKDYYLFDRFIDGGDIGGDSSVSDVIDNTLTDGKLTLYDVCPLQCGVSQCTGYDPVIWSSSCGVCAPPEVYDDNGTWERDEEVNRWTYSCGSNYQLTGESPHSSCTMETVDGLPVESYSDRLTEEPCARVCDGSWQPSSWSGTCICATPTTYFGGEWTGDTHNPNHWTFTCPRGYRIRPDISTPTISCVMDGSSSSYTEVSMALNPCEQDPERELNPMLSSDFVQMGFDAITDFFDD